jgi:hypothetical protein
MFWAQSETQTHLLETLYNPRVTHLPAGFGKFIRVGLGMRAL